MRLIALTGYDEHIGPLQTRDRGFDAHLVKPTTLARIAEALTS
jgi:CheY-like chemotaxis protein